MCLVKRSLARASLIGWQVVHRDRQGLGRGHCARVGRQHPGGAPPPDTLGLVGLGGPGHAHFVG